MSTITKIVISVIVVIAAFATGRYLTPEKVRTEVKTVEVEKIVVKKEHIVKIIKQNPDGSKETTIVTDRDTNSNTHGSSTDSVTEITKGPASTNISVLAGSGEFPPKLDSLKYGLSIQRSVLGPITVGAFGFSNGMYGASVGLNF